MKKTVTTVTLSISLLVILVIGFYLYVFNNIPFMCNHYKFKSDEEYNMRTIEFNKNGYMQQKLNNDINVEWKKRANQSSNLLITAYIPELKQHMSLPLKNTKHKTAYFASVVVMFRYEDAYINEWIHYYIMHGIEHFFMYSNENSRKTAQILQPFVDNGYVTLIEWNNDIEVNSRQHWNDYSTVSLQNLAFMDFVKNHKHKTKWVLKVDIDEFMYPKNTRLKLIDVLSRTSLKYFAVPRIDFGNNGHITKPTGLILENYTRAEVKPSSIKTIVLSKNISYTDRGDAHGFKMKSVLDYGLHSTWYLWPGASNVGKF